MYWISPLFLLQEKQEPGKGIRRFSMLFGSKSSTKVQNLVLFSVYAHWFCSTSRLPMPQSSAWWFFFNPFQQIKRELPKIQKGSNRSSLRKEKSFCKFDTHVNDNLFHCIEYSCYLADVYEWRLRNKISGSYKGRKEFCA